MTKIKFQIICFHSHLVFDNISNQIKFMRTKINYDFLFDIDKLRLSNLIIQQITTIATNMFSHTVIWMEVCLLYYLDSLFTFLNFLTPYPLTSGCTKNTHFVEIFSFVFYFMHKQKSEKKIRGVFCPFFAYNFRATQNIHMK